METAKKDIPILISDEDDHSIGRKGLWTLDDLNDCDIPTQDTAFNTCTRSGNDRRQQEDRRAESRAECDERRSGRDRRMMSYF